MQTFCSPLCAAPRRSRLRRNCSAFASIAQLAEHAPRKRKVASSILAGGYLNRYTGRWSRGMILRSGRRGRGFDSRTAPEMLFLLFIFFFFFAQTILRGIACGCRKNTQCLNALGTSKEVIR